MQKLLEADEAYIRAQIQALQKVHRLTVTRLSEITGYERRAYYRMMKGAAIGLTPLRNLSKHFNLSMDFWFPPRNGMAVPLVPEPTVVLQEERATPSLRPLTKKMLQEMNRLSPYDKRRFIVLTLKHAEQLPSLVLFAEALAKVEPETKQKIVAAVRAIIKKKRVPAP